MTESWTEYMYHIVCLFIHLYTLARTHELTLTWFRAHEYSAVKRHSKTVRSMRTAHPSIMDSVVHLFICSNFFLITSSVSALAVAKLVCCERIVIPNIVIVFIVKITARESSSCNGSNQGTGTCKQPIVMGG